MRHFFWHLRFFSLNACRIVYTIDSGGDEDGVIKRYGFAYGTLAEHAERGEERFSVEWHAEDDSVWYDLFAFSWPNHRLARLEVRDLVNLHAGVRTPPAEDGEVNQWSQAPAVPGFHGSTVRVPRFQVFRFHRSTVRIPGFQGSQLEGPTFRSAHILSSRS